MPTQLEDHASAPLPTTIDLSIIIVSWNVWPLLQACLQSIVASTGAPDQEAVDVTVGGPTLAAQPGLLPWRYYGPNQEYRLEVIVVDSASSDETVSALPAAFPWVRLLPSSSNLGFTRGNNWGYRESQGDFVFFLNPDTELLSPQAAALLDQAQASSAVVRQADDPLTLLRQTMADELALGMVGPQLRYGDQQWQNSRRRFPTHWTGFFESTWLGQLWPNNPWSRAMHMLDQPAEQRHEVDWLNGSALFCRRTALEAIRIAGDAGPFDEQFFMYSEELDLCQRMKLAGWHIAYLPQACILHYEGRSSEQVVTRRHILFNTSKIRYYQKYFGSSWATLLRAYLLFEYLIQIGIEGTKLLLGHKPALRRSRIQGYVAILRSRLSIT